MQVEKLINLTGRDVFVHVDGELVALPSGPRPVLIDGGSEPDVLEVSSLGVSLGVHRGGASPDVLFLPEPSDGVAFLVSAELLARLPHRDDLFCADSFGFVVDVDDDHGPGLGSWLVSVRADLAPVDPEARVVQASDFDDPAVAVPPSVAATIPGARVIGR